MVRVLPLLRRAAADSRSDDAGATAEIAEIADAPTPVATSEHRLGLPPAVVPSAPPAWAPYASSDYAKAIAIAESGGFTAACDQGKASDVLALGDAARFTGHTDEATAAYEAVRRRAPGQPAAAEAAFDLGKLAFDHAHDYAKAVAWFSTYQSESPDGPLALDAAGRLIEAKQKAGDKAGAKEAASKYLARWPDGPRAALARSLLGP